MDNYGCFFLFSITFHIHFWCFDHDKQGTILIYYAEVKVENFTASVKTTHTKRIKIWKQDASGRLKYAFLILRYTF